MHHGQEWMMQMIKSLVMILALPIGGCVSAVSDSAICAGSARATTEHAAALADDGGLRSQVTGARLIRLLDAGCAR